MPKTPPIDNPEYFENFEGLKRKRALKVALEMRNFEHELYWKRAVFGWGIIAVAFGGFFSLKEVEHGFATRYAVACFCFLVSLAWLFLNKGSMCWHDNWDAHVENLEDEHIGPLFKTVMNMNDPSPLRFGRPFNFSSRRINEILALTFAAVGLVLMCRTAYSFRPLRADVPIFGVHDYASPSFWLLTAITVVAAIGLFLARFPSPKGWPVTTGFQVREPRNKE
ncbi:MAG: hypothetical protein JSR72_13595 [Proteobacteria bacterium]|nr:hypothetical protein [Pseudomonadota bacterium]